MKDRAFIRIINSAQNFSNVFQQGDIMKKVSFPTVFHSREPVICNSERDIFLVVQVFRSQQPRASDWKFNFTSRYRKLTFDLYSVISYLQLRYSSTVTLHPVWVHLLFKQLPFNTRLQVYHFLETTGGVYSKYYFETTWMNFIKLPRKLSPIII